MDRILVERIVVQAEPDFVREALVFSREYFEALLEGKNFCDRKSLSKEENRYDPDSVLLDEHYADLLEYLTSIRRQMPDLWKGKEELTALFNLHSNGQSKNYFLDSLFDSIASISRPPKISLEEFIIAAKFALIELLQNDLEVLALSEEELAEIFGNYHIVELDFADIIQKVQELKVTDSERILLLDFFANISDYYEKLISSMSVVEELCISSYELIRTLYEERIQALTEGNAMQDLNNQWLQRMDIDEISFRREEDIHLIVSIVEYNGLWLNFSQNFAKPLTMGLGLIFMEMTALGEQSDRQEMLDKKQLIALSDSTRFQVVNALAERPYYAQELADKLGVTAATLSHHMQIMINSLLVSVRIEGRRTYYRLKTDEIKRLACSLLDFAESAEKREDA